MNKTNISVSNGFLLESSAFDHTKNLVLDLVKSSSNNVIDSVFGLVIRIYVMDKIMVKNRLIFSNTTK